MNDHCPVPKCEGSLFDWICMSHGAWIKVCFKHYNQFVNNPPFELK